MDIKKRVVSILLIFIIIMLSGCERSDCYAKRGIRDLLRQIERGNLSDITLAIYNPMFAWRFPITIEDRIGWGSRQIIEGVQLEEYIDVLMRLRDVELIPIEVESEVHTVWYYVFEDKYGNRIFDFAVGGTGDVPSMFINGIEFERHDEIFFEIIRPFVFYWLFYIR